MGTLKLILGFGMFVLVAILGIKVVPPFFSNYELEDAIKNEALQATYTTRSEDDIRTAVIKHARDYDIPLTEKEIKVTRTGTSGNGSISITAEYTVPLDLPGYSTTLEFRASTNNKGVY